MAGEIRIDRPELASPTTASNLPLLHSESKNFQSSYEFACWSSTIIGMATGTLAYNVIKHVGFPERDQYNRVSDQVNTARDQAVTLSTYSKTLSAQGYHNTGVAAGIEAKQYTALAEQLASTLPHGYHPLGAEVATGGGSIVIGFAVGLLALGILMARAEV